MHHRFPLRLGDWGRLWLPFETGSLFVLPLVLWSSSLLRKTKISKGTLNSTYEMCSLLIEKQKSSSYIRRGLIEGVGGNPALYEELRSLWNSEEDETITIL